MSENTKNVQTPATPENKKLRRILWAAAALVLVVALAVVGWYLVRYQFYDAYKQYIVEPAAAVEGSEFKALKDADPKVKGFALVAENDLLKLYANQKTGEVAIHDLRNGQTVYSNPPEANNDKIANKTNKNYLKSQFFIKYFNASLSTGSYDSFSKCVDLDNVTAESIPDGVRFIYEVGDEVDVYLVPSMLSDARYQELYSQVDKSVQKLMFGQANSFYAQSEDGNWRVTTNGAKMPIRSKNKISQAFMELGMTEEEYYDWERQAGVEIAQPLGFTVVLEWRLMGDAVECTVPADRIEQRGGGMVSGIQLLPYMAAASTEETGYIVVPNGSGSIIEFNNGKTATNPYSQYIYDMDLVDAEYNKVQNTQTARLPLYAICREDSSVLVTVERGASLAAINADISGRSNSYNSAYVEFTLRGDEKLAMFGAGETADMPIVEDNLYAETLTLRYTLLTEENKGYNGVANYYRDRLIKEGVLTKKAEGGDIPFYYDVIGAVKETAHTLGVQHLRVKAMTTFNQADEMAQYLNKQGVSNQVMNFQGWMNGGYYHDVVDKVKVQKQVGTKAEMEALNESLTRLGGELYADVAFQNVSYISKRYRYNDESSRYYGAGYAVSFGEVNPANLRRTASLGYSENLYDLLSPKFLPYYVGKFIDKTADYDLNGISLRDLGYELHADKRRTNLINREEALMVVESQLAALRDTGRKLMISGGNDYALPGVSHILGAPLSATEYFIVDDTIPLYEMIMHGCVDYTGIPLNTTVSNDWQSTLLKMIEYGASTRYIFTWQDATEMKYTGLNKFYATTFSAWADDAVEKYNYVNGALSQVSNAAMVGHEDLSSTLVKVIYDNGVTIYINYGAEDAQADGSTVPAKDYLVKGGVKE